MYKLHYSISVYSFLLLFAFLFHNLPEQYFNNQKGYFYVQVVLDDFNFSSEEIQKLRSHIEGYEVVNRTLFIDKSNAIALMQKYLPKNAQYIGKYNPLPSVIKVYFNAKFLDLEMIDNWTKLLQGEYPEDIKKVVYNPQVLSNISYQEKIILPIVKAFFSAIVAMAVIGIIFIFMSYYKFIDRKYFLLLDKESKMTNLKNDINRKYILGKKIKRMGTMCIIDFAVFHIVSFALFLGLLYQSLQYPFVKKYLGSFESIWIKTVGFYIVVVAVAILVILLSVSRIVKKKIL